MIQIFEFISTFMSLQGRKKKSKNRCFNREYGLSLLINCYEWEFRQMFRMTRSSFNKLCDMITPYLQVNMKQAICSSKSPITVRTRLACTLRWLAGGSHLDIANLFGVSMSNFFNRKYGVLWRTMRALDIALLLTFKTDRRTLRRTAKAFSKFCGEEGREIMTGCVMALDGLVIKTRQPRSTECDAISSYRNRKGCFAIVCLAGCDASCRFTFFSAEHSGGTNDVMAWNMSRLKHWLERGNLPDDYYFIGDQAFVNTNQFLTPWPGSLQDDFAKDSFNYHLSLMRQCIERAFGLMVRRWGVLWRPLQTEFCTWGTVAMVCAKLHNFCIDEGYGLYDTNPYIEDTRADDNLTVTLNETAADRAAHDVERPAPDRIRRRYLTEEFERRGTYRPQNYAVRNSNT